jgi:hypothetical protein
MTRKRKRGKIQVWLNSYDVREVSALHVGKHLAVHRGIGVNRGEWAVSHIASGRVVDYASTRTLALALAEQLDASAIPWETLNEDNVKEWLKTTQKAGMRQLNVWRWLQGRRDKLYARPKRLDYANPTYLTVVV